MALEQHSTFIGHGPHDPADTLVNGQISAELPPPALHIGRYVILDRLGSGSMGTVFLALDPALDRKIAIKLHRPTSEARLQARLQREAQAMARICHPNVVGVHDVGHFNDELFVAMEYVECGTLRDWLEQPHDWREIVSMFDETGQGLAAAHAAGLVHRDFKPANVLLDHARRPKITDFGLVCASKVRESCPRNALDQRLTRAGAVLGTPAYMAPEQFCGQRADSRSDQFGYCVALHEGLWGTSPFAGDSRRERGFNVVNNHRVPRPAERSVPRQFEAIVDRGLAWAPEERWPSMTALLEALRAEPARGRRWVAAMSAMSGAFRRGAAGKRRPRAAWQGGR